MSTEIQTLLCGNPDDPEMVEALRKDANSILAKHLTELQKASSYMLVYKDSEGSAISVVGCTMNDATELYAQLLNSMGLMLGKMTDMPCEDEDSRITAAAIAMIVRLCSRYPKLREQMGFGLMIAGTGLMRDVPIESIDPSTPETLLETLGLSLKD